MKSKILFALITLSSALSFAGYEPIFIATRTLSGDGTSPTQVDHCSLTLTNVDLRYGIEWSVSDVSPNWMMTAPNKGHVIAECNGQISCILVQDGLFSVNHPYYVTARQFIDDNGNGSYDAGEFTREWALPHVAGNDMNDTVNTCTFSK